MENSINLMINFKECSFCGVMETMNTCLHTRRGTYLFCEACWFEFHVRQFEEFKMWKKNQTV